MISVEACIVCVVCEEGLALVIPESVVMQRWLQKISMRKIYNTVDRFAASPIVADMFALLISHRIPNGWIFSRFWSCSIVTPKRDGFMITLSAARSKSLKVMLFLKLSDFNFRILCVFQ